MQTNVYIEDCTYTAEQFSPEELKAAEFAALTQQKTLYYCYQETGYWISKEPVANAISLLVLEDVGDNIRLTRL